MNETAQLMIYGGMVLIPWALSAIASQDDFAEYSDAAYMSGLLCAVWIVTNMIAMFVGPPESKALHPLIDLAAMGLIVQSMMNRPRAWKMALALLFAAQIALHGAFWSAWYLKNLNLSEGMGQAVYLRYLWTNGVIWTVQLVAAGWPGGRYVAGRIGAWVRDRGGGSAHQSGRGL